jgi:hypothetical protein
MSYPVCCPARIQWFGKSDRFLKAAWKDAVYAQLEKAYRDIGGITLGSGFQDSGDMLRSVPVWRLVFEKERLVSVMVFKEKKGCLKMVAYAATDASDAVKEKDVRCMVRRSYAELSGALLITVLRQLRSSAGRHLLAPGRVFGERKMPPLQEAGAGVLEIPENARLLAKLRAEFPEVLPFVYARNIGGRLKLKVLVGSLSHWRGTRWSGRVPERKALTGVCGNLPEWGPRGRAA